VDLLAAGDIALVMDGYQHLGGSTGCVRYLGSRTLGVLLYGAGSAASSTSGVSSGHGRC